MTNWYVATAANGGSDSNPGTQLQPFLTIETASTHVSPGDTVHVGPGTVAYTSSHVNYIYLHSTASGTVNARVTYISDIQYAAKIVGTNCTSSSGYAPFYIESNYIDVIGFDVTGSGTTRTGILNEGAHNRAIGCYVHDIAADPVNGGAGIDFSNGGGSVGDNWAIGNIVDNIGVGVASALIQGIYVSTPNGGALNNRVSRVSAYGIHLWHQATAAIIANNLVYLCGSGGGLAGGGCLVSSNSGLNQNTYVVNNIFMNNNPYGVREYWQSTPPNGVGVNYYYNNCFYGNTTAAWAVIGSGGSAQPTNNVLLDPQFVNYQPNSSGDYHLKATSPCIDTGTSTDAPSNDYDSNSRPQGAGYDIGPYEYPVFPVGNIPVSTTRRDNSITVLRRDNVITTMRRDNSISTARRG